MNLLIFLLAIIILMVGIFKGKNIVFFVPLVLLGLIVFTGEWRSVPQYSLRYGSGMLAFILNNALIFFLGVLFGAYISASGLAKAMAAFLIERLGEKRVMLALVLLVNLLMLGGISAFIMIFTIYPIVDHVFNKLGIPKRFVFALIGVSMATYMIGSVPGSPQIQNILPTAYLDSTLFSGAVVGLIVTVYLFTSGYAYLSMRLRHTQRLTMDETEIELIEETALKIKGWWLFSPLMVVFLSNIVLSRFVFIQFNLSNHATTIYALNSSLVLGILLAIVLANTRFNHFMIFKRSIFMASKPLLFVGTTVGFGAVISTMPFIMDIKDPLLALSPMIAMPLTVMAFAGLSGSAMGGLSIAYPFLGEELLIRMQATGVSHEAMHRISTMASVTLDTLPTNGTTMTMLKVTGLDYKTIYLDYFLLTVVNTFIALCIGYLIISLGIV